MNLNLSSPLARDLSVSVKGTFAMREETENLSLGEIEALARDALVRAGASIDGARAVAWAIRISERNGDRRRGLSRLPRLIEGLRNSAIAPDARPKLDWLGPANLRVDARGSLSDYAFEVGVDAMTEVFADRSTGQLVVDATGDTPIPGPWVERMANQNVAVISIGGEPDSGASMPRNDGAALFEPADMGDGLGLRLLAAITGRTSGGQPQSGDLFEYPVNGSVCLLAVVPRKTGFPDAILPELGARQEVEMNTRRVQADATGVQVPSELLARILIA